MMTDQVSSFDETLPALQADTDARRFDGTEFDDAVLRHATAIPTWETAECWRYPEWPGRTSVGVPLPPHAAGIDLVAVKHDGSRVAIQCKARSGDGSVTPSQVQNFGGAAPSTPPKTPLKIQGLMQVDDGVWLDRSHPVHRVVWSVLAGEKADD